MTSAQTQPELEKARESGIQITVHEYHNSALQPRTSQQNALREGYKSVKDATSQDPSWKTVKVVPIKAGFETKNAYIYNRTPPVIKTEGTFSRELKDWGAAVTEDEVYTLDDLEEFDTSMVKHNGTEDTSEEVILKEGTSEEAIPKADTSEAAIPKDDTSEEAMPKGDTPEETILKEDISEEVLPKDDTSEETIPKEDRSEETIPKEPSLLSPETREKRVIERSLSQEPERKKKKLRAGSLFRLIPQPHLHPSVHEEKPLTFSGIFKKPKPTFIAPYTKATFPNNSRLGWLIPIRGSFPWENIASGEILDNLEVYIPAETGASNCISWSEDSLIKFWNHLLDMRKKGKLGRMAISFHPTRQPKQSAESSKSGLASGASKSTNPRGSSGTYKFSTVDFFKVYHDAPNALYVRKALDLFTYSYTHGDGRVEKVRMLKGARLVLVDEVSEGVLIA